MPVAEKDDGLSRLNQRGHHRTPLLVPPDLDRRCWIPLPSSSCEAHRQLLQPAKYHAWLPLHHIHLKAQVWEALEQGAEGDFTLEAGQRSA
jgi:hypothetical protein